MPASHWAARSFARFGEHGNQGNIKPHLGGQPLWRGSRTGSRLAYVSVREQKGEAEKSRCHFVEGVAGMASRRGRNVRVKTWTILAKSQRREERPCAKMGAQGPAAGRGGGLCADGYPRSSSREKKRLCAMMGGQHPASGWHGRKAAGKWVGTRRVLLRA